MENDNSFSEFCIKCNTGEVKKIDMLNYLKIISDNFDPYNFDYIIQSMNSIVNSLRFDVEGQPYSIGSYYFLKNLEIKNNNDKTHYIINNKFNNEWEWEKKVVYITRAEPKSNIISKNRGVFDFFKLIEKEFENQVQKFTETENLNKFKTKLSRRQKIALLESVGVMKFLEKNVFAGNQTQLANFLSMIIDYDQQNIRKDINSDTGILLNDSKIANYINPILTDLGLKSKE